MNDKYPDSNSVRQGCLILTECGKLYFKPSNGPIKLYEFPLKELEIGPIQCFSNNIILTRN